MEIFPAGGHWWSEELYEIARFRGAAAEYNAGPPGQLLHANSELPHVGDAYSSQPIHRAVMTRQIDVIDELPALGADTDRNARWRSDHSTRQRRLRLSRLARRPAKVSEPAEILDHFGNGSRLSTFAPRHTSATLRV